MEISEPWLFAGCRRFEPLVKMKSKTKILFLTKNFRQLFSKNYFHSLFFRDFFFKSMIKISLARNILISMKAVSAKIAIFENLVPIIIIRITAKPNRTTTCVKKFASKILFSEFQLWSIAIMLGI